MDCSPLGSSVPGIFQASILQWIAISSSRGSSWPRDRIRNSYISCTAADSLPLSHQRNPNKQLVKFKYTGNKVVLKFGYCWEKFLKYKQHTIFKRKTYNILELKFQVISMHSRGEEMGEEGNESIPKILPC